MKRIEFIGGSAIGKSTVLQEAMKLRKDEDEWLTSHEARVRVVMNIENKNINLRRLMQMCMKLNIMKRFHGTMASLVLAEYEKDIFDKLQDKYNDIAAVYLDYMSANNNSSPIQNLKTYGFYYDVLFKEIMTLDYFQVKDVIVYDEGIIYNNPSFSYLEKSQHLLGKHIAGKTGIIPAGIVFCNMEADKYIQRCRQRRNQGDGIFLEHALDDPAFEKYCRSKLKYTENIAKVMKDHGIPVLEIEMCNSAIENAALVCGFINGYSR